MQDVSAEQGGEVGEGLRGFPFCAGEGLGEVCLVMLRRLRRRLLDPGRGTVRHPVAVDPFVGELRVPLHPAVSE